MFLINTAMEKIPIGTAALIVVLGMAVVFFGLILLMFVTKIAGAIIGRKKAAAPAAAPAAAAPAAPAAKNAPAPSSASSPSAKSKTDRCFLHSRKRAACALPAISVCFVHYARFMVLRFR